MADHSEELEVELSNQIDEQKAALEEITQALEEDADNADLLEMQGELKAAVEELESTLLDMKRARLLAMLEDVPVAAAHNADGLVDGERDTGVTSTSGSLPTWLQVGGECRFRYMDGRWYHGRVSEVLDGHALVQFLHPTRSFMLGGVDIPFSVLKPPPSTQTDLVAGCDVLVWPRGADLWDRGTVLRTDGNGSVTVTMGTTGQVVSLPRERVAVLAAEEDFSPSGAQASSSEEEEGSDYEDEDEDEDEDGADATYERSDEEGRTFFGLGSVMDHALEAAAAGQQTDTVHFAEWERHNRGIASKLLAKMGYQQGQGLGSAKQGIASALDVNVQLGRRGLGAGNSTVAGAGKKRKKKRGGEKARKKKKMLEAQEAKEAVRQQKKEEERRGGAPGLFAFINNSLGDGSEAAQRLKAHHSKDDVRPVGSTAGSEALRPAQRKPAGLRHTGKESRHQLMSQQDHVAAVQQKVEQLKGMLQRNKHNKGLRVQIEHQLNQALQALSAAQAEQARVNKIVSSKESEKKWMKF